MRKINFNQLYMFCFLTNPLYDNVLESSRLNGSYTWSNIGFSEGIGIQEIKTRSLSGTLLLRLPRQY